MRQNKPKKPNDKHRMQFEFSSDVYERLVRLKAKTDAASYAQVTRRALRFYERLLELLEENPDLELALVKDGEVKKVELFL